MAGRKAAKGGSNPAGLLVTDDGGRPVTDAGGRLVFQTDSTPPVERLDPAGTPPAEPTGASNTDKE